MSRKLSKEEVLQRLTNSNPNFDYSEFEYINCETKSKIICDKGHIFYKSLETFKEHPSCPECFKENRPIKSTKPLTQDEAIEKLTSKHPSYNFLQFKYVNAKTKSIVICDKGHRYESSFDNTYKKGRKCPYCAGFYKTEKQVKAELQEIHPTYDFTYFNYKRNKDKSIVICDKGHIFESSYDTLKSCKCPECAHNRKKSVEEMRRDMKELEPNYDFSLFEPKNTDVPSIVICPNGHRHNVRYGDFINGVRCPKCSHTVSRQEKEIVEFIKSFYEGEIITSDRKTIPSPVSSCRYLEIDILLPDLKIGIEFNGKYWHTDEKIKNRSKGYFNSAEEFHKYKTNECLKKGITLLHIAEEDYLKDKEKVLNEIKELIMSK